MGFHLANVDGRAVLVLGPNYFDVETASGGQLGSDPNAALADGATLSRIAALLGGVEPTGRLADVELGPPVPRPSKVFGVGLNYRRHAIETGMGIPDVPVVFTKFPSCLVGPTSDVVLRSDAVDYEGELVVVIGPGGADISVDAAWGHVAGLTIGQDISDRVLQRAATPAQFSLGKSFDTFGPTGPFVVSLDLFDDPSAVHLTTAVNGEVRQDDTTADLIFDIPTLVSYLSHITTLEPGDLIFTGTPDGVGVVTGSFLADGDLIATTIEGIGTMTNRCVRGTDYPGAGPAPAPWQPSPEPPTGATP